MSTVMAAEAAADGGVVKQCSERNRIKQRPDLRGAGVGTQGNMSHNSGEAFKSGNWVAMLWKSYDGADSGIADYPGCRGEHRRDVGWPPALEITTRRGVMQ